MGTLCKVDLGLGGERRSGHASLGTAGGGGPTVQSLSKKRTYYVGVY
jgi:hypothetical protein